jgi:hypothetical protein
MKVRQRVCFHSSGNRSSRGRSECALLRRTVAPHEDHEIIGHRSATIALCQCGLKTRLYGSSASRHLLSAREPCSRRAEAGRGAFRPVHEAGLGGHVAFLTPESCMPPTGNCEAILTFQGWAL